MLRALYANYKVGAGGIRVRHGDGWVDMATAEPRAVLDVRRQTMGYVSQFLRVIPRVPVLDIVAEPLRVRGVEEAIAMRQASEMLARLNVPERLWHLAPATFSGGEQQRVNIARGFISDRPVLLLDEPTASLDAGNRAVVVDLVRERKQRGAAIVAIVHDDDVRAAIAETLIDVTRFAVAA